MRTDQGPHGLQFHNDGISFDLAGVGECELCDNLSANCLFFLVFQSAPRGFRFTGYLTFLERCPAGGGVILSKDFLPPALYVTVLANACS